MKILLFISAVISLSFMSIDGSSQQTQTTNTTFNPTGDWQIFGNYDGIKVEYKEDKIIHHGRNALMVFFKITNTNNSAKTFEFTRAFYRNDECSNCNRLELPEYNFSLNLAANEVQEGSINNMEDHLKVFNRFTKLVPGMSDTELTNVVFSNVSVQ